MGSLSASGRVSMTASRTLPPPLNYATPIDQQQRSGAKDEKMENKRKRKPKKVYLAGLLRRHEVQFPIASRALRIKVVLQDLWRGHSLGESRWVVRRGIGCWLLPMTATDAHQMTWCCIPTQHLNSNKEPHNATEGAEPIVS
jgi:hypothetical protein